MPPAPFTLGVASGDPVPDGVVLWTRLAPDPLVPGGGMPGHATWVCDLKTDTADPASPTVGAQFASFVTEDGVPGLQVA